MLDDEKIATFDSENIILATIEEIRTVLGLSKVIDNTSQIGKMRDAYAVQLWSFRNVVTLLSDGCYGSATALFPYACLVAIIFSTRLGISFRLFLVELDFYFFSSLL